MKNIASGGGRTTRLLQIMDEHALSVDDVATLVERSRASVYNWRVGKPHAIPATVLRLLERLLADGAVRALQDAREARDP